MNNQLVNHSSTVLWTVAICCSPLVVVTIYQRKNTTFMQFYVAEGREEYILCYHSETIIYPLIFMCMFFFSVQYFLISYN